MRRDPWLTATGVLRLATQLVDGIQAGMAERGFPDVRPAHGFAFARLSESPATTVELADHLGITKQAASELVAYLEQRGYLRRDTDPADRRAKRLTLTERGVACTRAAQLSASAVVRDWSRHLDADQRAAFDAALAALVHPGRLRPSW